MPVEEAGSHTGGYGRRRNPRCSLERATRIEPATSSLGIPLRGSPKLSRSIRIHHCGSGPDILISRLVTPSHTIWATSWAAGAAHRVTRPSRPLATQRQRRPLLAGAAASPPDRPEVPCNAQRATHLTGWAEWQGQVARKGSAISQTDQSTVEPSQRSGDPSSCRPCQPSRCVGRAPHAQDGV